MIDGSMLPFEDNIALTKKVVDTAHAVGLSVEGELGTIGKTDEQAEDGGRRDRLHRPRRRGRRSSSETGVDSLADRHRHLPRHLPAST